VSGVVNTRGTSCDERLADSEAHEQTDPPFGGFAEKVWVFFGSPVLNATEVVIDASQ